MRTKRRILSFLIIATILFSPILNSYSAIAQNQNIQCGTWAVAPLSQPKDKRIEAIIVSGSQGDKCQIAVDLKNKTQVLGAIGGYTLELTAIAGGSQILDWKPENKPYNVNYLAPILDSTIYLQPLSASSSAEVIIQGYITAESLGLDTGIFLLRTGLAFAGENGSGCIDTPDEILFFIVLRLSDVLSEAGSGSNLLASLPEIFIRAGDVVKDVPSDVAKDFSVNCLSQAFRFIAQKPAAIAQIGIAYLTWLPKVWWDLWKFHGESADVHLVYTPIAPTATPTPTSARIELDQSDLSSVLRWLVYAIDKRDLTLIEPLIGNEGTAIAPYATGLDLVGYNNSSAFIPQLEKALGQSDLSCLGYDYYANAAPDKGTIFFSGNVDWSQFPGRNNEYSEGIIFGFFKLQQRWKLVFVSKLDSSVASYNHEYGCPTLDSVAMSTTSLAPLNRAEYFSVLQWIKYATLNNDISVFEELMVGNSIQLIDGNNVAVNINKTDFLEELSARLTSKPNCEFFMFEQSGRLIIRISNWSPGWGVDSSTIIYLILEMKNNQWALSSVIFGDLPPSWADGLERISYDTISLLVGNTEENNSLLVDMACKEVRPTRLQISDFAFVSFYPTKWNNVRDNFGMSNTNILTSIPPGTAVKIIDGPGCADNWVWWKIRVLNSGLEGWTSEGDKDAYWLIPCESRNNCGTR